MSNITGDKRNADGTLQRRLHEFHYTYGVFIAISLGVLIFGVVLDIIFQSHISDPSVKNVCRGICLLIVIVSAMFILSFCWELYDAKIVIVPEGHFRVFYGPFLGHVLAPRFDHVLEPGYYIKPSDASYLTWTWAEKTDTGMQTREMVDFPLVPKSYTPPATKVITRDNQVVSITGSVWWCISTDVPFKEIHELILDRPMSRMATPYKRALVKAVSKRRAAELVPENYEVIASRVQNKLEQALNLPGFVISRVVIEKIEPAASAERVTRE